MSCLHFCLPLRRVKKQDFLHRYHEENKNRTEETGEPLFISVTVWSLLIVFGCCFFRSWSVTQLFAFPISVYDICHKVALRRCGQNFMRAFNLVEYLSGADYYNTQCTLRKVSAAERNRMKKKMLSRLLVHIWNHTYVIRPLKITARGCAFIDKEQKLDFFSG